MNKMKLIIGLLIIGTLFSFSVSLASYRVDGEGLSKEEIVQQLQQSQTDSAMEMTISEMALSIGDSLMDYVIYLYNDDLTIDRIVFNKVISLDPNFFKHNHTEFLSPVAKIFCALINDWYRLFQGLAIIVYLGVLIGIGIKIILGPAVAKATAKDSLVKWTLGIALLTLFPFVMRYAFTVNEAILQVISNTFTNNNNYDEFVGAYIGKVSDTSYDQKFEERSPEYISRSDYVYTLGSASATIKYFESLEKYKERGDVMRIMRAMAGITGKLIYVILWLIMFWQMLVLLFIYTKRYLMIAFLIIIFPITVIQYVVGLFLTGKGGTGFSAWCMEFFLNVFVQTVHAIIYGMIGGVVMANVQSTIVAEGVKRLNWLVLICAINFLFEGEAILKKIIRANAESLKNASETSKSLGNRIKKAKAKLRL